MRFRSESSILQKKGYKIEQDLGEGSYAKVKSATWLKPGTDKPMKVALKIINQAEVPQDFKEKFLPRELDIVKLLQHGNVIRTMEIFQGAKKIYLSLEYAGHGDLLAYIQLRGAMNEPDAATMFKQIVCGLRYLHDNGVVHRDLKCENVLLSNTNTIKIADFGFARRMTERDLSLTFCGSAAYAAPEVLQGKPYHGITADVWSIGVILFIMICAIMPFRDTTMKHLIMDQKYPLRFGSRVEKTLSLDVKELTQSILKYEAEQRLNLNQVHDHNWMAKAVCLNQDQTEGDVCAGTSQNGVFRASGTIVT